jgi:hypothetical protein
MLALRDVWVGRNVMPIIFVDPIIGTVASAQLYSLVETARPTAEPYP